MDTVDTMPSHFGWARHDVGQERKEEESGAAGPDNNSDPNTSWFFFAVAQIATRATRTTRIGMHRNSKWAVKKTLKYSGGMELFSAKTVSSLFW